MANLNRVFLIGNLTRDPELRVTPSGFSICKFSLATSRTYKTQDGQSKEETTFVDIDAFGKPAELIAKYMTKGRSLFVEGRLRLDQWETNTGEKRSKLNVVLENFQFLGNRGEGGGETGYRSDAEDSSPPSRRTTTAPAFSPDTDVEEEDVPF